MDNAWRYVASLIALLVALGGCAANKTYCLKPVSIDHFYSLVFYQFLKDDPETLTQLGIIDNTLLDFHSDKLTDASPARQRAIAQRFCDSLALLHQYNRTRLNAQERLSYDIMEWYLDNGVRGEAFQFHAYPVNQYNGVQIELPNLMLTTHAVVDGKSARNYITRLNCFGTKFDQVVASVHYSEQLGVIPPQFVIQKSIAQMRDFITPAPADNVMVVTFRAKLAKIEGLSPKRRETLAAQAEQAVRDTVYPAYGRLIACMMALEGKASDDPGVWKLPKGDTYYAYKLRQYTTTDLTPEQVHALGLAEVARIHGAMRAELVKVGCGDKDPVSYLQDLARDGRFLYPDNEEGRRRILADYQAIIDEIDAGIRPVFNLRLSRGVVVQRIPEFKEQTAPQAYYQHPSMDGNRPGTFFVNLRDLRETPKFGMYTLAYHETIPGHHYQHEVQRGLKGLPAFRRVLPFTAYTEGWAMYAEQLAWEQGFEADPYANLGRLQAEMWRAVRLVVDTGIHAKRWSREQAIAYMVQNTGMPVTSVTTEIERYIVDPGQACAYKIGMLKILELRDAMARAQGADFSLPAFHDAILGNGAMPLSILEREVKARMP